MGSDPGQQIMSASAILFPQLDVLTLPYALWYRCRGLKVLFYSTGGMLKRPGLRHFLKRMGIIPFDYQTMPAVYAYDLLTVRKTLATLFTLHCIKDDAAAILAPLFPNIDAKRLRIAMTSIAHSYCEPVANALFCAQTLAQGDPDTVRLFGVFPPLTHSMVREAYPDLRNAMPVPLQWIHLILGMSCRAGSKVFGAMYRRIRRQLRSSSGVTPTVPGRDTVATPVANTEAEVLFFPHQGLLFGNLLAKDHYYAKDTSSPLHHARMQHLEYSPVQTSSQEQALRRDMGITFGRMEGRSAPIFKSFLAVVLESLKNLHLPSPAYLMGATVLHWRFTSFLDELAPYSKARLALIGYDYLFPKPLALALRSLGIATAAMQERFIQAFYEHFHFIADAYFVASTRVIRQLKEAPDCAVDHFYAIGMARQDDMGLARKSYAFHADHPRILVFDYHSDRQHETTRLATTNSWANNIVLYQDIVRLAQSMPEARFTIRGKNVAWMQLPYFSQIRDAILACPNITVDAEYDSLKHSYVLAGEADCIIAKHTSIADEALAVGIPVVFHDYGHNHTSSVRDVFGYDGYAIFAHSYDELCKLVLEALLRKGIPTEADMDKLNTLFAPAQTGMTIQSLRQILHTFLADGIWPQTTEKD